MNKGIELSMDAPLPGLPGSRAAPAWMKILGLIPCAQAEQAGVRAPRPLSRGSLPLFKTLVARDAEIATLRRAEDQQVLWANAALHRQWRLSLLEPPGLRWLDLLHPQDKPHVQAQLQALQAPACFELEYRLCLPSGAIRRCRERGCLALSEEGELQILSLTEDLGSSKPEQSLRPSTTPPAANDAKLAIAEPVGAATSSGSLAKGKGGERQVLRNDLRAALRRANHF